MAKKIGDKSCHSNSDIRFWFFLIYLITTVHELTHDDMNRHKMIQNKIELYK
jgi:hypothetical protein